MLVNTKYDYLISTIIPPALQSPIIKLLHEAQRHHHAKTMFDMRI